jgi:acyl-CoA synthetase
MRQFLTLHHPASARRYYAEGLWQADTLYALLARHAAERPQQWAARDSRRRLTWADLRDWVDGVAADFRRRGLTGGDRVSVWLSNRLESVVTFLACSREGLACNPSLHRAYSCAEIARLLDRLRAKVLVTEPHWGADRHTADLRDVLAPISSLQHIYEMDDYPGPGQAQGAPATDPDRVVYLAFTSGTTGIPKCIMHSDNTLLANARDLVGDWGLGCEFVPDDPPAGMSRLDWIIETEATYVMGVPTHAMDVLAEQQRRQLERLGSVEIFYIAGAPIPHRVAEAFLKQGIKPQNVYGMTENSSHQYTHPDDDAATLITTCGRGGRAYEVRLFDPADPDREVAAGEEGHIGGRGAALMLGYFGDQVATEASFNRDGWFLSGDLGILDDAGNLQIRGRLKELIIRGGYNIYPAHIEALAMRHPEVKRAACFPVADERLGERVCLAVIGAVDADTLLHHLAAQGLSKHDMPEYFLRLEGFPVSTSGKILQRQLAEMTKRGELAPTPIRWRPKKDIT